MMKRIFAVLCLSTSFVMGASAQFDGPSRYTGIATVEQAQTARRGQRVVLEGFIIEHLRARYYKFRDATGEIRVRITRHIWRDRQVTSKTPVRLTGSVDREVRELYVVVDRMQILE